MHGAMTRVTVTGQWQAQMRTTTVVNCTLIPPTLSPLVIDQYIRYVFQITMNERSILTRRFVSRFNGARFPIGPIYVILGKNFILLIRLFYYIDINKNFIIINKIKR